MILTYVKSTCYKVDNMYSLTSCHTVTELWISSIQIAKTEEGGKRGESKIKHWRLVDSSVTSLDAESLHTARSFELVQHLRLTNVANRDGRSQQIDSLHWFLGCASLEIIASPK